MTAGSARAATATATSLSRRRAIHCDNGTKHLYIRFNGI